MKKEYLIIAVFLIIVTVLGITLGNSKTVTLKNNNKDLAVYVYSDIDEDYIKVNDIPSGEYELNTTLSHCLYGSTIESYNSISGTVTTNMITSDKCYYYFDLPQSGGGYTVTFPAHIPYGESTYDGTILYYMTIGASGNANRHNFLVFSLYDGSTVNYPAYYISDQISNYGIDYVINNVVSIDLYQDDYEYSASDYEFYSSGCSGTGICLPYTLTEDITVYAAGIRCFPADTDVEVYDEKKKKYKKKKIKDITYKDLIKVWNFDKGEYTLAKPLWIKKKETTDRYHELIFDDGSKLKIINNHRIFNKEAGKFTPAMDEKLTPIGTTTYTANAKEVKLISKKTIYEEVDYYNVITEYHMNIFANNILTSCRLNNIYPIKDMKFVKDNRELNRQEDFNINETYYEGLRIAEQDLDINKDGGSLTFDSLESYVEHLEQSKK